MNGSSWRRGAASPWASAKGNDIRDQFGVNQWLKQKQLVVSLDLAKRDDIIPGLRQAHWDLVIVDEAHRMSWSPPARKTARYALGELLRDSADHYLLLTATPHKGSPENFSLFLQLLDRDAYADVRSIQEAMERRAAPFYLRRTKEAMVYFPERQPDGKWAARKIFTRRIPHTVDFQIDGAATATVLALRGGCQTALARIQRPLIGAQGDDGSALRIPLPAEGARVHMDGRRVFGEAVHRMGAVLNRVCEAADLTPGQLDLIVPHQANGRIIEALRTRLRLEPGRVWNGIRTVGNTSSSSIPLALDHALRANPLARRIGLCAFGAGYTFGAALLERH